MDADYSVEFGPTSPALELPWQDPEGRLHYVKLRSDHDPGGRRITLTEVARIPEARRFPALGRFLVEVNSPPSPWLTAKCDVWMNEANAAENLYHLGFEQSCYVDMVLAGEATAMRPSLEAHQRLASELARGLDLNEALAATAEIVVRRCYFHLGEADESDAGFCLTFFLSAYGTSPAGAAECWGRAMEFAAGCLLRLQPQQ